ncbi:lipopolysaccharide transport periplasmic protein LptA [Pseudogulbenkiania sp. NH8B]|uniref:Lipopolysaccharide export system protein LptA n=2 Tax=Pseudogulbenkiania TaxID=568394 RepID=A0A1Y6BNX8_9NEIS|nr:MULTISPECIES: lipopolysaccharide transport periplasmic protein LptA [Pseudogulbenkiania]EEG07572.1 lipopolysaccharide transport periplasmic protein LptA [Pseudogulbenkiania ferrooxidans 2002]BAK78088.1 lipopolysaccharide transport periplasmic protein LptA [Pseudogulbenkiania sp. NH8B]SMF19949.1 lipopolysaccharide export system protein LptA [Pseudogulbenkiania subflava DSM 22618]
MRNKFTLTLAVLAGLCSATAALAEKADQSKPIEINANSGTLDQLKGHTVWEGNVVVTQGTLRVNADRVVVTRDDKGNQTVQATGKVVTFRQKMDGKDEYIEGQASRLDYTGITNTAVLTGNARVKRGEDLVIGDVITYNTQSQTYQVKGGAATGPNKGRITVILQPQTTGQQP